jgi:nucleotide-binding universal stress UspA family protein
MTALHSAVDSAPRRNGRTPQRATRAKAGLRVLVVVDGSERANSVVDYVTGLTKDGGAVEAVVLNVQTLSGTSRLRGYDSFRQDEIRDRLTADLGMPIVNDAGRRLQKAGITFTARVEVGDPVETIVRCATAEHCDLIVIGESRPGPVRRWLARHAGIAFGSLATGVAQLSDVPVVIAK